MNLDDAVSDFGLVPPIRQPDVTYVNKYAHDTVEEETDPSPPPCPDNELAGYHGVQACEAD